MRRWILSLSTVVTFAMLAACVTPSDLDSEDYALVDVDDELVASQGPALSPDQMIDLITADDPQTPAWEYLDAAPLGEAVEGIPTVFSGTIGHQGYAVAEVVVPADGQLRIDPSYCGNGDTGCVVYLAVDRDGDTMLEASEVEGYADGMYGETVQIEAGAGTWTLFVAGSVPEVDGFVVEILWSNPGGSDGTVS